MFKIKIIGLLCLMSVFTSHPVCGEEILMPFVIPDDHPILPALNQIFQEGESVVANEESLKRAGFEIVRNGSKPKRVSVYVLSHRDLHGYLLKLYTSEQREVRGLRLLLGRAKNARRLQGIIDREGYHSLIQVPKKWIYPISNTVSVSTKRDDDRLCCALVVEEMDILNTNENYKKWKSHEVTPELLDPLFLFLRESRLRDHQPKNMPFCKNGKVACVDLEPHTTPFDNRTLGNKLSSEMKAYWKSLFGTKRRSISINR